jgi:Restriction endonuclease
MAAARCPNCTRKIHIWNNHSGFCSKRCREESRSACLNCGNVGLFKHERLGCCSDECRYWYVTTLLGYDREFLLTPAWDKVVYHVRLPSANAEISSLQLDELEFERAHETILVVAAPAWISRQKVLAELPYSRFDNSAWQHLRLDGTLSPEDIERFRTMCYDDPLLYHKLGVHVFEKIRGQGATSPIMPASAAQFVPGGMTIAQPLLPMNTYALDAMSTTSTISQSAPLQLSQVSQAGASLEAPEHFAAQVRTLFALRGYQVTNADPGNANTLLLTKGNKRAIAVYHWQPGMVDDEPVRTLLEAMGTCEAKNGYVVTNGQFTLQVEDLVAKQPVQLIDGDQFSALVDGGRSSVDTVALEAAHDHTAELPAQAGFVLSDAGAEAPNTVALNGNANHDEEAGVTKVISTVGHTSDEVTVVLVDTPISLKEPDATE